MGSPSIISIYGSHNAAIAVSSNDKIYIVEVERFLNHKNCGLAQYKVIKQENIRPVFQSILEHVSEHLNISKHFDLCLWQNTDVVIGEEMVSLSNYVEAEEYKECEHHRSHAGGSFYQSDFKDALIFSYDGGGNDGFFHVYYGNREKGVELIEQYNVNLGFPYMIFGEYFSDIHKESVLSDGNLVYSGKIMGLEGYGEVNTEWLPAFEDFYDCNMHNNRTMPEDENFHLNKISRLSESTSLDLDTGNRLVGKEQYNVAATSQRAFENTFLKYAEPHIKRNPKLPIVLTGGCALNILLNTRIKEEFKRPVFVAPNSNDCGLAVGMLLNEMKPKHSIDVTYSGIPLLDYDSLFERIAWSNFEKVDLLNLSTRLLRGEIIGVARGGSEHGPRALGNRSILCNPSAENMKDILNEEVKHREWFRPFAPVVRLEDVNKYFIFDGESRHMALAAKVRKRWQKKLEAITHVDGTARIQTVTRKQNPFLHDLLTEFSYISDHAVLLNTSFNVNGKPILSTVKDALEILNSTGLSGLVIEDYMICKEN